MLRNNPMSASISLRPQISRNSSPQTPSLPDADPRSDHLRCSGRESKFLAARRLIKAGMKEVNYLDATIRNKYTRNPDKLRAWDSASRIERAPQREKKAEPLPTGGGSPPKPSS